MVRRFVVSLTFLVSAICLSHAAFGSGGTTAVAEVLVPSTSVSPAGAPIAQASRVTGASEGFENGIPLDTKITLSNWQQYESFMPDGMVELFRGNHFWKMPEDVEINVGPTQVFPQPQGYLEATQKYGPATQVEILTNGHYALRNYVAGMPFPNPSEPNKGWKILADTWYAPTPRIFAGTPETGLASVCTQDEFGRSKCFKMSYVYRMVSHIYTPGFPQTESDAGGAWFTEWAMIEWPEELKYTASLTIFSQDEEKLQDDYVFDPQLRRTLRVSTGARCAPLSGLDYTRDDARFGFNGGIGLFQARWLRDQRVLALTRMNTADGVYPANYDMPLGFAKPLWGQWEVRDTYVIDVRRAESEAPGYCYGKRIMFIDKAFVHEVWDDLFDPTMKLWKVMQFAVAPKLMHGTESSTFGSAWMGLWDMQNRHATIMFTADGPGRDMVVDEEVPKPYDNITKYSTPGGLMMLMK
jgi:hypothetical protein